MIASIDPEQPTVEDPSCSSPKENLVKLKSWFQQFDSALVAFSSGVDSSVLAYCAQQALSARAIAVTSISPSLAQSEIYSATQVAKEIGIELIVVTQDDLGSEYYVANQVDRCYFCRSNLVQAIRPIVEERKIAVCVDGTHADDMKSPRPGVKALREAGFRAPFLELKLAKEDIRSIARMVKLSNSDKPPEACLSSRIAYGQRINQQTLHRIEQSEKYIRRLIDPKIVRVRTIGTQAIVELDLESIPKAQKLLSKIQETLMSLGYLSVQIDPNGYSSGRMLDLFVKDNV
jgi:pyridinium-3,5-biscarboxylic acid mononucleotide sulfurtransferase